MSFARRFLYRPWRWWLAVLALLTAWPLYERRSGGPLDLPRHERAVEAVEAVVERDPGLAEERATELLKRLPAALHGRLHAARARARVLLLATRRPYTARALRDAEADANRCDLETARARRAELDQILLTALATPSVLQERLNAEAAAAPAMLAQGEIPPPLRARLLFLAGRYVEAAAEARRAGDAGLYVEAESLRRLERREASDVAAILLRSPTPLAPLGHFVIGRALLARGDPAGWLHLDEAVGLLASNWMIVQAALDPAELYREARARAEAAQDAESLRGASAVLAHWHRVRSADVVPLADAADTTLRLARALARPEEARAARRAAAALYRELADRREPASAARTHDLRRAGEALAEAGDFAEAADLFRDLPTRDAAYREGMALSRAGLASAALARLGGFVDAAAPDDALVPSALLERARILASLRGPALKELDRFFLWPTLAVTPQSPEWREALMLKARLQARQGGRAAAAATLAEFIERYGPVDSGAPRSEVALARAQLAVHEMEERRWAEALRLLDAARSELPRAPASTDADLAGVLMGDAYLGMGRAREAQLSYDDAALKLREPGWRIVALVGRARASLRLGELDAARGDYRRARAVYDADRRAAGEAAVAMLEGLRRELP